MKEVLRKLNFNCLVHQPPTNSKEVEGKFVDNGGVLNNKSIYRLADDFTLAFTHKKVEVEWLKDKMVYGVRNPKNGAKIPLHDAVSVDGFAGYLFDHLNNPSMTPTRIKNGVVIVAQYVKFYMDIDGE